MTMEVLGVLPPDFDDSSDVFTTRGGLLRRLWQYARSHPLFVFGSVIVLVSFFLAAFAPFVVPYNPVQANANAVLVAPSASHWFGTDNAGLDVFSRTLAATRIDVTVALVATLIALILGSVIGLLASFYEGVLGEIVMRTADVVQAFPLFVLAMIIVTTAGDSLVALVFVIAFLNTPIFIRLMRSQVLSMKHRSFIDAARVIGNRERVIAFRHVLWNCLEPGLIQASVTVGFAILLTAGLSFLGAGVQPPTAEWGSMISSGSNGLILGEWWPSVFPGIMMSVAILGFAIVGEGLQDLLIRGDDYGG